jgi:ATP-dependent DNA ligase
LFDAKARAAGGAMTLPLRVPYLPMEARSVESIPEGPDWQYEPKWDGFRCIVFRDGGKVQLQSKSGQPLARYFPDLVTAFLDLKPKQFVLDGEIVVPAGKGLSFDALLQRIHPAATRIARLAAETPASFIAFDLLVDEQGRALTEKPLEARRGALEKFASKHFADGGRIWLSPATRELAVVQRWFKSVGGALDGVIAKKADEKYLSGERAGMVKIKHLRTVDCVIGGFRYASKGKLLGSILLGLYDRAGLLNHVGFCSSFNGQQKKELTPKLEALIKPPGFTGQAPGGPSRWSTERSAEWKPVANKLVVEVQYDHFTGGRFRHGTKFLRWRPDKAPKQCTLDQVGGGQSSPLKLLRQS